MMFNQQFFGVLALTLSVTSAFANGVREGYRRMTADEARGFRESLIVGSPLVEGKGWSALPRNLNEIRMVPSMVSQGSIVTDCKAAVSAVPGTSFANFVDVNASDSAGSLNRSIVVNRSVTRLELQIGANGSSANLSTLPLENAFYSVKNFGNGVRSYMIESRDNNSRTIAEILQVSNRGVPTVTRMGFYEQIGRSHSVGDAFDFVHRNIFTHVPVLGPEVFDRLNDTLQFATGTIILGECKAQ